jgi:hypothetical protein
VTPIAKGFSVQTIQLVPKFNDQPRSLRVIMSKKVCLKNVSFLMLRRERLFKLKLKAIRRRVWFRALSRIDRVLVDLTIRVVDVVHSSRLSEALFSVVKKLEDGLAGRVSRAIKEVGFSLARKLSLLAQKWGNDLARNWMSDMSFAKFLAIMHINNSRVFKA